MFNRVSKASRLAIAVAACCASMSGVSAIAQDGMRPVPRFSGTSIRDHRSASQKAADASGLQWRTSREVAPPVMPAVAATITPSQPENASAVSTVRYIQKDASVASHGLNAAMTPVLQARYQDGIKLPDDAGGLQLPPGLKTSPELAAPKVPPVDPATPLPDFFADPFGDPPASPEAAPNVELPTLPKPSIQNELRNPAPLEESMAPQADEVTPPLPFPKTEALDAAKEADATPANPFDATRSEKDRQTDDADLRQLEDFELPRNPNRTPEREPRSRMEDEEFKRPAEFSCDEFRKSIADSKIQNVSLDISPPYRPDVIELDEFRKLKSKFDEGQEVRDWQSIDGRKLGRGRLRDLAYEKVVIETEFGTTEELPIHRISEADLAFLSKNWGLPQECLIEQVAYAPRSWQQSKVTWKASNLCHKPLYFEEVNLERYGHTAGPFAQPLVSSAHFFLNIAVLPYKMGVHSPSECQYTLGYYRPGNCAPWICPPVPISLRGGLYQAAVVTGAFWLIP